MSKSTRPSIIEKALYGREARSKPGEPEERSRARGPRPGKSGGRFYEETESGFEVLESGVEEAETSAESRGDGFSDTDPAHEIKRWDDAAESMFRRDYIFAGKAGDGASDQFDMLRTKILREMREKGWRTLGITSPMPRSGKTTISINLSISIAKGIHKDIVLVDLDLRNPTIANYLGIDASPDLSDFLDGNINFREPFVNPGIPRLLILPNKTAHDNSSEMLTSRAAVGLAKRLRAMDDVQLVVYDLPPALPTDDTLAFMPQIDCLLIVVADGFTTRRELEATQKLLKNYNVLGYVLNQLY